MFGFGSDVLLGNLKVDPYIYAKYVICDKINVTQVNRIFYKFLKFEPILVHIWDF